MEISFKFVVKNRKGTGLPVDKDSFYLSFTNHGKPVSLKEITTKFSNYNKKTGEGSGVITIPEPLDVRDFKDYDISLKNELFEISLPSNELKLRIEDTSDVVVNFKARNDFNVINVNIERLND